MESGQIESKKQTESQKKKIDFLSKISTIRYFSLSLLFIFCGISSLGWAKAEKTADTEIEKVSSAEDSRVSSVSLAANTAPLDEALKNILSPAEYRDLENFSVAVQMILHGRDDKALNLLKDNETLPGILPYRKFLRAIAYKNLKKFDLAKKELLEISPRVSAKLAQDVFWQKADVSAAAGDVADVQTHLRIKLGDVRDPKSRLHAHYLLGKALWNHRQQTEALREFSSVLIEHPGSEFDGKIEKILQQGGKSIASVLGETGLVSRAENLILVGQADLARDIYQSLFAKNSNYLEKYAIATFKSRDYPRASLLLEKLLALGRSQMSRVQVMTMLAQAYARQDETLKAIDLNKKIMRDFPKSADARIASNKLGFLYFDAGKYDEAIPYLARSGQGGKLRNNPKWYLFWSFWLTQRYPQALKTAEQLRSIQGRERAVMFDYWMARVHEKAGQKSAAQNLYKSVARQDAQGYYGLLAKQRLQRGRLLPQTLVETELLADVRHSAAAGRFSLTRVDLKSHPHILTAAFLYRAGLDLQAFSESQMAGLVPTQATHFQAMRLAGNSAFSFQYRQRAVRGQVGGCGSACVQEIVYPPAYEKYVIPFAKHFGIQPALAWAVMRQESVFKPEAASWAFAYGLMQIIPPTGREIALALDYPRYHTGMLNQPRTNVLFGTYYLSYLGNRLGREPVYQMAAYNAGPDAVGRWIKKYGALEKDEFIELIAYEQTYDYVKKVWLNWMMYSQIY